jgi:hypothetical protein
MPPKKTKSKVYADPDEFDTSIEVQIETPRSKKSGKGKVTPNVSPVYKAAASPSKSHNDELGIAKNRKCRDVPWLIVFFLFWIVLALIAYTAVKNGDPRKIMLPVDYLGNFCGVNNTASGNSTAYLDQSAKPYLYYFDPVLLNQKTYICVSSCPNATAVTATVATSICRYDQTPTIGTLAGLITSGLCTSYTYASSPLLGRCLITAAVSSSISNSTATTNIQNMSASDMIASGTNYVISWVSDIINGWPILAGAAGVTVILCFIWLLLLQVLATIMVWITVIGVNLIMCGGSVWLYFYWQAVLLVYNNSIDGSNTTATGVFATINNAVGINTAVKLYSSSEVNAIEYGFIAVAVISGLILLITLALIRRIAIAIQVIKVASKACLKMPLIVFFPVFIWVGIVGVFVYFVWIGLYILTPTVPWAFTFFGATWTTDQLQTIVSYVHLFGCLWGLWFLNGFNQLAIAGAIGTWYWTFDKTQKLKRPVIRSVGRTCRYHLGSIAIGSLLIAIVELIRIVLYQVSRQVAKTRSTYLKYLVACLQCFMKCVSMIFKFINKNAYIYIAITGKGFFASAGSAASLLLRNAAKTIAIDFVSDFILLISKLIVSAIAGYGAYIYLIYAGSPLGTIRNPYVIAVVGALAAFMVAVAFFSVYHMAIDTIFLSALEDMEKNDGSRERPYYMPEKLRRIMGLQANKVI